MCPASVKTSRDALQSGEAKLWVLLVGINHYQDDRLPDLSYSAVDCQGLGEAIAQATQTFPAKTLMVHHDFAGAAAISKFDPQPLADQVAATGQIPLKAIATLRSYPAQPPTLAQVRSSLQQIVSAASTEDTVLFYFSGHGILDENRHSAVLCLHDTQRDDLSETGLSVAELLQTLGRCEAHQQIVWLDACHSGGMTLRQAKGEAVAPIDRLDNPTPQLMELLRQRAAQSKGFYALLSCDQTQQSWEFPELGHGVFTYFLMRGLLGEAADAQGVIEADALYKYVYYQTLRYIDKTNQQLRLINQQKRGRGESSLQPEYPLQTPKRIIEGVGELILGLKPIAPQQTIHPRQAIVADALGCSDSLTIGKLLRRSGNFELRYLPQPGKTWDSVQDAIQACLSDPTTETALLYLRGEIHQTETGESLLILRDRALSRSWLRQQLRKSTAQQIVILDCPGAADLDDWVEDLQLATGSQCLLAAAAPDAEPDRFAQALLETLTSADSQTGLPIAGWIAQLQTNLAETKITLHVWLSGSAIEVLPGGVVTNLPDFDLGLCPYMGLRAFGADDAPFFFGRESLTQQLLNHVRRESVLAIVGASGSGKSSIALAGVVAQLRQGKQIPGSETWWIRSFRPGAQPIESLLSQMIDGSTEKERSLQKLQLEGLLYQGVEGWVHWLRSRPEPMVVLVVDQFEELFTLAAPADCQRFLELLLGAVEYASDRFKLIFTLRTDFIAPCLEVPALAAHLQRSSILIPPTLATADYRQIILKPAEKVGLSVDPELVEVLLQDLSQGAGDLPLLEFVLTQVWEQRQAGSLSLAVYQQQIGGLRGALERKAQAVYDSLDPDAQACARWIFLSLTQLGEGTEDTRRRIGRSNLQVRRYAAELVDRTLQALVAAKLIVIGGEEERQKVGISKTADSPSPNSNAQPATPSIEVAHEILIRHWSTLRWWLEENRSRLRAQRQIEQSAQQWSQSGRQSDFLLQGVRLDAAEELYVKYTDELARETQEFIEAGLAARQQQQRETQKRLRRTQQAAIAIGILGAIATFSGGVAFWQRQQAQQNQIRSLNSLSEAQLLSHQQIEAQVSSLEATELLDRTFWPQLDLQTQTVSTLAQAIETTFERNRLLGHTQQVNSVSVRADGTIATGSDDGTIRLWNANGSIAQTLSGHQDRVTVVAFSPDGRTLATGSADRTVRLWVGSTMQRSIDLPDQVTSVVWSPNGQLLAAASRDRSIRLLNPTTGATVRTITSPGGWVNSIAFSPDGRTLAAGGEDKIVRLWNVSDGRSIRTLSGHSDRVTSVVFRPDGKALASGSGDRTVRLWNLATNTSKPLTGYQDQINSVAYSPDGEILLATSRDRTLKLWRANGWSATLQGHGAAVLAAVFSPDGRSIVSTSADKTARIWDVPPVATQFRDATALRMAEDAIAVGRDRTVELWDRKAGRARQSFTASDSVSTLALSENQLAAGMDTGAIDFWQGTTRQTLAGHTAKITSLSFSLDRSILASASEDKTIRLWNAATGALLQTLSGHADGVAIVTFSPEGNRLATGSYDSTVKIWRTDGSLERTLAGQGLAIAALAFDPSGRILAAADWDNNIRIWRVEDGTLLQTLSGHQDGVTSLSFSADGRVLASGSVDRTIRLWNPTTGMLLKTIPNLSETVTQLQLTDIALTSITADGSIQTLNLNSSELHQQGCDRLANYLHQVQNAETESICR